MDSNIDPETKETGRKAVKAVACCRSTDLRSSEDFGGFHCFPMWVLLGRIMIDLWMEWGFVSILGQSHLQMDPNMSLCVTPMKFMSRVETHRFT